MGCGTRGFENRKEEGKSLEKRKKVICNSLYIAIKHADDVAW
jgi:hypothetical protein